MIYDNKKEMMMEDLDLDSFIANIEQSAPQEDLHDNQHLCQECNVALEDHDGVFVCPNCSAQATNILQIEETELHFDEAGQMIAGQRVCLTQKKSRYTTEYGWAWSTDEAIIHLLSLQIGALEKLGLVPESFRQGVKNMWLKFWVEHVAPYIRDEYDDQNFIPISLYKTLKRRDVEVLVKVQDKVMVPTNVNAPQQKSKRRYKMYDTYFHRYQPDCSSDEDIANESLDRSLDSLCSFQGDNAGECSDNPADHIDLENLETEHNEAQADGDGDDSNEQPVVHCSTKNLDSNSITILTLNRSLAFIEAASRCLNLSDPIFASDIVRACNQLTIPFYAAHKSLPEGMMLNSRDKLMFLKTRPPSPVQLTRAATILIFKIYGDKLPFKLPVPNFNVVLKRLVTDMNLPLEIVGYIQACRVDFSSFRQTQPIHLTNRCIKYLPQYDRWAFAVLICHVKKLFNLGDKWIQAQSQLAAEKQEGTAEKLFVLHDWVRQMSLRIQLIMSYDPFILFHPMADIRNIQSTPQVLKYVETILGARVTTTTRSQPNQLRWDENFRSEMTDFLKQEIPKPAYLREQEFDNSHLDKPIKIRHPIQDALCRTCKFWEKKISQDEEVSNLIFQDFTKHKMVTLERVEKWSIFEDGRSGNLKHEIPPEWPYCLKLMLFVGGFIFLCEPRELLREVKVVEKCLNPVMCKTRRRASTRT